MDHERTTGFGARLKALRKQRQLTQTALDFALDLVPGTVGRWERGDESPEARNFLTLAQQLDASVYDLLLGPATHGETSSAAHSPELSRFLMTEAGRRAIEAGLDQMLRTLPSSFTVDRYQRLTQAMIQSEEVEADKESD